MRVYGNLVVEMVSSFDTPFCSIFFDFHVQLFGLVEMVMNLIDWLSPVWRQKVGTLVI